MIPSVIVFYDYYGKHSSLCYIMHIMVYMTTNDNLLHCTITTVHYVFVLNNYMLLTLCIIKILARYL